MLEIILSYALSLGKWVIGKTLRWYKLTGTTICIDVPSRLDAPNISFGLCYIRDGKDKTPTAQPTSLKNKVLPFKPIDRRGHITCKVRYMRDTGFQFKCFVDHPTISSDHVISALEDAGYLSPSEGQGKRNRIWFILPDYPTCKTVDEPPFVNNFFYPE